VPSTHALTKVTDLAADDVFRLDLDPARVAAAETARGIKASDLAVSIGNGVCPSAYGAKFDGTTDDTSAWQLAMASGYPVVCSKSGTSNLEGGFTITEDQSVRLNPALTLERQGGGSGDTMIHMYGSKWIFDPNGATIRQDLYASPNGILRIGPAAGLSEGDASDVDCRGWQIASHFKLLGPWNNNGADSTVGLYIDSARRLDFTTNNPNYGGRIAAGEIYNCDFNLVMATDANRHHINLELYQFGTAALVMNACYGNHLWLRIETPQAVTPEAWREAIHFGTQNYLGTESGTTGYSLITAAWRNKLVVYGELAGSGTKKARLIRPNEPGTTANEGYNDVVAIGQFGGGIGVDGTTSEAGIGTNWCPTSVGIADYGRPWKIHGWEFRRLDDDSGHIQIKDSTAIISGSKRSMEEAYSYDLFHIDNVGPTTDSVTCTLTYAGKQGGTDSSSVGGEIKWHFPVRNGVAVAPYEMYHKPSSDGPNNDWDEPFHFVVTHTTGGTSGKYVVSVATASTPSDYNGFVEWKTEMVSANAESASNLDWTADVSILSTSTAGAVTNPIKSQKTRIKKADETKNNDSTLAADDALNTYVMDANALYSIDGVIFFSAEAGPDIQWLTQASIAPVEIWVNYEYGSITKNKTDNTTAQTQAGITQQAMKVNGYVQTNASAESTLDFQWAQQSTHADAATIYKGSWIKVGKLQAMLHEN